MMMERARRHSLVAAAALAFTAAAGTARAADPSTASTQTTADEVRQLRARLEQLEKQVGETARVEKEKDAARVVDAMVKDADRHSQLLDMEGFTAGFTADRGFVIRSASGDFLMHPWVQFAFRDITNYREDSKTRARDDLENGFEIRRAKIGFDGNLFGPDLKYTFIWATDRKTQVLGLEEAWFVYKLGDFGILPDPVSVQAGQFKNYFAHEQMASSKKIFAVERTLLNDVFTGGDDFIQGVGLLYNEGTNGGPLQAGVVINDGSNDFQAGVSSTPRNFQDYPTNKWDFGAAARVQYKFFGKWKDYEDFTTVTSSGEPLLVAGAAIDYSEAGDFDQILHTVDVQYKTGPLALYGAFLGRSLRHGGFGGAGGVNPSPATAGTGNFYDYGFVGKAGYALNKQWELFGQYSYINFDSGEFAAGTETDVHEVTLGVNYYLHGHAAKLTVDGTWLPNGTPVANDGGGILAEPNGRSEFLLRAQFQLLL